MLKKAGRVDPIHLVTRPRKKAKKAKKATVDKRAVLAKAFYTRVRTTILYHSAIESTGFQVKKARPVPQIGEDGEDEVRNWVKVNKRGVVTLCDRGTNVRTVLAP
jgi:hypothetical protein